MYRKSLKLLPIIRQCLPKQNFSSTTAKMSTGTTSPTYQIEIRDRVGWIRLNRPKQLNAISSEMYGQLGEEFSKFAKQPEIKLVVVTGNGKYFSSGNDLKNFDQDLAKNNGDLYKTSVAFCDDLKQFVNCVIDFPKPLIGAVNGPSIGIMFTILGLFDSVVCSETATFNGPFTALGQSPEGCSTRQFPKIFGTSLASELLYFNYRMDAQEAMRLGFVSRIIPVDQFESHLEKWLYDPKKGLVNTCYPNSMFNAKALVRNETERAKLKEANQRECEVLIERFQSEDRKEAIKNFFLKKSVKK